MLTTVHISQARKLRPLGTSNLSEVTTPESANSKVSIQTGLSDTTAHVLFSGLLLFSLKAMSDSATPGTAACQASLPLLELTTEHENVSCSVMSDSL